MKSTKVLTCPHCRGMKIVCNGVKRNGRQNYLRKDSRRPFQAAYVNKACVVESKERVVKMLCRDNGIRDCEAVSSVSHLKVTKRIKEIVASVTLQPKKHHYFQVQIDEQWSYVGRKDKKVWMLYAYAVQEDEILAFTMGKQSAATVRN